MREFRTKRRAGTNYLQAAKVYNRRKNRIKNTFEYDSTAVVTVKPGEKHTTIVFRANANQNAGKVLEIRFLTNELQSVKNKYDEALLLFDALTEIHVNNESKNSLNKEERKKF
jgi:hypothetical protein